MSSKQHDKNRERPIYQSSKALPAQSGIYEELDKDNDALGSLTEHRGFKTLQ